MFLFKRKESNNQEAEKKNAPANNPFQNIQKDSLDENRENNLQNQENFKNSSKNNHEKEKNKKTEEEKETTNNSIYKGVNNSLAQYMQNDIIKKNENVKGATNTMSDEATPLNSLQKGVHKNIVRKNIERKIINLYSSSSSEGEEEANEEAKEEAEEEAEEEGEEESKADMEATAVEGRFNKGKKNKFGGEQNETSFITIRSKNIGVGKQNEGKKIFANITSEGEKLVFLTKKVREENKKKLERKNEIIDDTSQDLPGNSVYRRDDKRTNSLDVRQHRIKRRTERGGDGRRDDVAENEKKRKTTSVGESEHSDESEENEEGEEGEKGGRREHPSGRDKKGDELNSNSYDNSYYSKREKERDKNRDMDKDWEEGKRLSKDDNGIDRADYTDMYAKPESHLAELNMLHVSSMEKEETLKEKELEIIKQQYLGLNKKKKKMQKPSEKFRNIFNFEWDQAEDTSKNDSNPLYQNRLEPQLLFGRGYIAGIDIREQRKKNNFYDKLVQNRINLSLKKNTECINYSQRKEYISSSTNKSIMVNSLTSNNSLCKNKSGQFIYEPKVNNIIKDIHHKHWSEKSREEMTDRDWRIFREDNEIYIKGGVVPPPIRKWEESNLSTDLLKAIKKAKYEKPTPIQMQAIPIALDMRDLIGIAETGSGKTAAFVLPMLSYVKQLPPLTYETSQDGPYALVIAPSRELAIQIYEETNKFASYCSCRTVAVVGGRNAESQAFELRRGVEIVIGTPGRLQDCLEKAYTVLNQCNYVILDEADRMMDMGFEDTVHFILDKIPTTNLKSEDDALALQEEMMTKAGHRLYRLTQMFSATMPPSVERLSRKYLRAPAYISIGDPGAGKRSIEQKLEFITEGKKKQKLQELLEIYEPPIIVFVNQKKVADIIAKSISRMKFRAVALHGGKAQEIREQTLNAFKNADFDILVATDVAGRGIDVHGVKLVINFDMPKDIESYTHRIGRTGRAGMKGLAISFVTEHDTHLFYDLKQFLLSSNNIVPLELANNPATKVKPGTVMQTPKKNQILYKN
ncbi:ATP-dependent RNA helicase DDX23, putative [Plasmodium malariae]|uniref:RNA helicase n=1 Tax=Plasmodium malariae TaxID=5858 RepID=A0A1C3KDL9_PLAMA|nr:ATP-dependent RNA helicase DDX23, putative [Plasmodium malariae]